jgi:hypothetical protein
MSMTSALQSYAYLEDMESAADDPGLQVSMDPWAVYGMNQQLVFGDGASESSCEWLGRASQQLRACGIAEDFGALRGTSMAAGLRFTEEEAARVRKLAELVADKGFNASLSMEQVALEDGHGIPAIAILVLILVIIVAIWISLV